MSYRPLFFAACGALMLSATGCLLLGPNYEQPAVDMPVTWHSELDGRLETEPITVAQWWNTLGDPVLTALIERAEANNLDLKIAEVRVREARAARGIIAADRLPNVGIAANYRVEQSPEVESDTGSPISVGVSAGPGGIQRNTTFRGRNFTVSRTTPLTRRITVPNQSSMEEGDMSGSAPTIGSTTSVTLSPGADVSVDRRQDYFSVGFDAAWELDIFGRVARAVEAADASIEAESARLRNVFVTLSSEVALNYIDYRTAQARLDIAHRNIAAQDELARLTRARYAAGLNSEFDAVRADAQLATFQSQVPTLATQRDLAFHRLGVLLDMDLTELENVLAAPAPLPTPPQHVPVGLPSTLLQRRPDIQVAERELAAATARIGVAKAERFPRFTLTGDLGAQSIGLDSGFLDSANNVWSIGPGISVPIFEGGRIRANIEVQNARQEQALYFYQQSILLALEEVENGLISFARERERRALLADALEANQRSVRLANERYTRGLEDFLSVVVAQAQSFESEDRLLQSQAVSLLNLIALYKALGGGWESRVTE